MKQSLARRLSSAADQVQSYAAFLAASELVAARHGISGAIIRRGPRQQDLQKLIVLGRVTVTARDETTGRIRAIASELRADRLEIERIRAVIAARQEALYLAHMVFGRPQRSLARVAGISHKALQKALAVVEDRRSDPMVDRMLDEAELQLMGDPA